MAQFRVTDSRWNDELDDYKYWLQKDGLSSEAVPPPLVGKVSLGDWQALLADVDKASKARCDGGLCLCVACVLPRASTST